MSDDKDTDDGSDWLSSQFDATAAVPAQPAAAVPPAAAPPATSTPAPSAPAPFTAAPSTPAPSAPAPPANAPSVWPGMAATSATSAATTPATPAATPASPVAPPPLVAPPAAAAPSAEAPIGSAPVPNSGGGFNWGLKPGGTVEPPPPAPASAPAAPATPPPAAATPPPAAPVIQPALVSPPTEPYVAPPTQPYVPEPTQPLSWDEFASTQQQVTPTPTPQTVPEQPTEAYTVAAWQPFAATSPVDPFQSQTPAPADPADPTSAIDSLFGEHKFEEYEEVGVLKTIQVPPTAAAPDVFDERPPREPLPRTQKVLLGVAAGLLAALILVGLYFLGQHLGTAQAAAAAAVKPTSASTGASSATPTPAGTGGPATPGVQQWTALQGGECIQPFTTAWSMTFTVVACTADHDAEMVFKGMLPDNAQSSYPSATDFQKEITPLCSAPTAINYAAAASVTDLQISYSYPPNSKRWQAGDRTYYCFVDRASGGNLPGDLSVPKS